MVSFSQLFRRATQPAALRPRPFAVLCDCGRLVVGVRNAASQVAACTGCQAKQFVLPASLYPTPGGIRTPPEPTREALARAKRASVDAAPLAGRDTSRPVPTGKRRAGQTAASTVDEVVESDNASTVTRPAQKNRSTSSQDRPKTSSAEQVAAELPPIAVVRGNKLAVFTAARRRVFTPLRLTVGLLIVATAGSGWLMWRSLSAQAAERSLVTAMKRGDEAFEAGNVTQAEVEYRAAVNSLNRLGRAGPEASRIRQRYKQIAAMNGLLPVSLAEVLIDIRRVPLGGSSKEQRREFADRYPAAWVLVSGPMISRTNDKKREYTIEMEIPFGENQTAEIVFPSTGLKSLDSPGGSQPAVLAGRIALITQSPSGWRVELDDRDLVVWTDPELLRLNGSDLLSDEALAVVKQQARALEVD